LFDLLSIKQTIRIGVIKQFMNSSMKAQLLQTKEGSLNQKEHRTIWINPIREKIQYVPSSKFKSIEEPPKKPLRHGPVVSPRPTRPTLEPSRSIVENDRIYFPHTDRLQQPDAATG
jgi:hypothetical protein